MPKFYMGPYAVAAYEWWKNGDHPQDKCEMVHPDLNSTSQFEPFLSEGKIVRRFRHPEVSGDSNCKTCTARMYAHGWIDVGEKGIVVCPGDWIVTDPFGKGHYPVKPNDFRKQFTPV